MSDEKVALDEHIAALGKIFCAVGARLSTEEAEQIMADFKAGACDVCVESRVSATHGIDIRCIASYRDGTYAKLFEYSDHDSALVFQSDPNSVN